MSRGFEISETSPTVFSDLWHVPWFDDDACGYTFYIKLYS